MAKRESNINTDSRLKNAGTSNMHYEYERPITQASNNLLRLGKR